MGRPSRKRPRPPPLSLAETLRFDSRKPRQRQPRVVSRFEEYGSIQSLVIRGPPPKSNGNPGGETTTTTVASVQQVWGALGQADIATTTAAPGLSVGVQIDVDDAGIAWLLHTPRQPSADRNQHTGLSETGCSQRGDSSLGPQQLRHAASAASTSTAGADSSQTTPLDPPCSEDNPRSANDCPSSGRQEQREEDARRSFCVCNAAVRDELSRVKGEFDDIPPAVFKRTRSACNPAEALGSGLFLNRSAMKLANIDAVAGLSASWSGPLRVGRVADQEGGGVVAVETRRVGGGNCCRMNGISRSSAAATAAAAAAAAAAAIGNHQRQQHGEEETEQQTEEEEEEEQRQQQQQQQDQQEQKQEQQQGKAQKPVQVQPTPQGEKLLCRDSPPPPFLFADLCGGPGGFSEYLLLRRTQLGLPARGWGISLRGRGTEPSPGGCRTTGNDCGGSPSASRDDFATSHDVNAENSGARREGVSGKSRDGHCSEDPCAWRLDHLSPWCDVSTETGESAEASFFCGGDEGRSAVSEDVGSASGSCTPEGEARSEPLESLAIGGKAPETNACPLARHASVCGSGHEGRGGRLGEKNAGGNGGGDAVGEVYDGGVCESVMRQAGVATPVAVAPPATRTAATTTTTTPAATATAAAATVYTTAANATAAAAGTTTISTTAPPVLEMRINYGPAGTGDLADEENMYGFVDAVLASTEGRRLDLVVADGGIEAARDSGQQESLMSPLVHSEALTALLLLEEGGSFVCKLFEVWTEPTASLVYLLHRRFRRIAIVKPITSRPASGERYLVCVGLLPPPLPTGCRFTDSLRAKVRALQRRSGCGSAAADTGAAAEFPTFEACGRSGGGSGGVTCDAVADGAGVSDMALDMKADAGFLSFLRLSNDRLASLQTKACARIIDVASSKRGRAWAFRDSKGRGGDRGGCVAPGIGGGDEDGDREGVGEGGGMRDEAALQCFRKAWRLDELEGISPC